MLTPLGGKHISALQPPEKHFQPFLAFKVRMYLGSHARLLLPPGPQQVTCDFPDTLWHSLHTPFSVQSALSYYRLELLFTLQSPRQSHPTTELILPPPGLTLHLTHIPPHAHMSAFPLKLQIH